MVILWLGNELSFPVSLTYKIHFTIIFSALQDRHTIRKFGGNPFNWKEWDDETVIEHTICKLYNNYKCKVITSYIR